MDAKTNAYMTHHHMLGEHGYQGETGIQCPVCLANAGLRVVHYGPDQIYPGMLLGTSDGRSVAVEGILHEGTITWVALPYGRVGMRPESVLSSWEVV